MIKRFLQGRGKGMDKKAPDVRGDRIRELMERMKRRRMEEGRRDKR